MKMKSSPIRRRSIDGASNDLGDDEEGKAEGERTRMTFNISVFLSPISGPVRWDIGHWRSFRIQALLTWHRRWYTKSFIHWQRVHSHSFFLPHSLSLSLSLSHISLVPHNHIYPSNPVFLDLSWSNYILLIATRQLISVTCWRLADRITNCFAFSLTRESIGWDLSGTDGIFDV